jgi:transcriptional regulator with XRE-family HTH domain
MKMKELLSLFGKRVRELRKGRRLSQERLADMAGIDSTFVGSIERGEANPSLKVIGKISDALNVSVSDLFPFAAGKKEAGEADKIRNELINQLYECDEVTLELLSSVFREIRKFSEERKK